MKQDASQLNAPSAEATASAPRNRSVSRIRHDLQSALGQILGFSEMLLEEAREQGKKECQSELELINQLAAKMLAEVRECFDTFGGKPSDLCNLHPQICQQSSQIIDATERLVTQCRVSRQSDVFCSDVARIADAAKKLIILIPTGLPEPLVEAPADTRFFAKPLVELLGSSDASLGQSRAESSLLIVDDGEENRELLSRRLSRLNYSVKAVEDGERALEFVAANPVDLILLDIVMPGLNGMEVLQRLKANAATRHIPVVMLSSADETDTVVNCIKLGADDFLPKPFNATLLMARIESSLAKKRLHDQEAAFLRRLQAEQDNSERLLLNILPKAIAARLKEGEIIIADGFPEVTVLFSDFVGFTKFSSDVSPKELIGRLNQVFSVFDVLCERYGLEKIKTIGDAYMVAGGIPTPRADHAEAVADLALAMQREGARLSVQSGQPFQMRIGINTGPVVAGVIGWKKFAYDLWGDTVNVASRMESHAPAGGIRVTAATYRRLRNQYRFEAEEISVKGKGEVQTYLLLGKSAMEADARMR